MYYKIVAVSDDNPDSPITYTGECLDGMRPTLMALYDAFVDPSQSVADGLNEWSGGLFDLWADDESLLHESSAVFDCDGVVYHVEVAVDPFTEVG